MTAETTPAPENTEPQTETQDEQVDLRNLQDKFHALLDQRNHFNDMSREARDARNLLNDQRREKSEELEGLKAAREAGNQKMKEHKDLRNAYQDQAKALIAQKKGQKGALERSLPLQARKLRSEIESALERQETTVLSPAKERDLIDDIRAKKAQLKELEAEIGKQQALQVDLDDTDRAIDDLFKQADAEHELVQKYHGEAQVAHEKFVETIKEMRVVQGEANQKHKEFIAYKTKADENHNKAMELREKVMAIRGERRAEYDARRKEIGEYNANVRRNVSDPKAIEKANESALEDLKKGGKISLGF